VIGNHLDCAKKIPKVAQMPGTVDVFDPRSGISGSISRGASAQLLIQPKSGGLPRLAREFYQ
jgi:hypothetical protein